MPAVVIARNRRFRPFFFFLRHTRSHYQLKSFSCLLAMPGTPKRAQQQFDGKHIVQHFHDHLQFIYFPSFFQCLSFFSSLIFCGAERIFRKIVRCSVRSTIRNCKNKKKSYAILFFFSFSALTFVLRRRFAQGVTHYEKD